MYALWVRDVLEVAYDQVRRHSGQAVRRQKRFYDKFAAGDWILPYYLPAKKCKDSPWIGPYLVVSLAGWAVGIQMHPDSLVLLVHCQDLKKIPCPRGLVSWINRNPPELLPTLPVLGASTVCRSTQDSVSAAGPVVGRLQSDGQIADSTQPSPGSVLSDMEVSAVNLSSVTRSRIASFLPQDAQSVHGDHILHPFFCHRLDVGPIHLTSIAHAFNYRIAVLQDGVKLAARVGRSRKAARLILDNVDIPWGHHVAVMFQIVCAPAVLLEIRLLSRVSPNVDIACEP